MGCKTWASVAAGAWAESCLGHSVSVGEIPLLAVARHALEEAGGLLGSSSLAVVADPDPDPVVVHPFSEELFPE